MAPSLHKKLFRAGTKFIKFTVTARRINSRELVFKNFGDPLDVVSMADTSLPALGKCDVLVRMLAAPVNPVDINVIQGKYALLPRLPSVGGSEGVGIVTEVGSDVKKFDPGYKVVVIKPTTGTWKSLAIYHMDSLKTIPAHMGLAESATLTINPCTAYRLLSDFQPIRENRELVVIQNGANSACGQSVIQLCKAWGIRTINIVRNRPDIGALKNYLMCLGATFVLTEQELVDTHIFKSKLIDKPVLGFNCVGGSSALLLLKSLAHSGMMVTYGGMSKKPVTIPTSAFIYKNVTLKGFWMTEWYQNATLLERDNMFAELINLTCSNTLKAPAHIIVHFDRFKEALANTLNPMGYAGYKYIIDLTSNY